MKDLVTKHSEFFSGQGSCRQLDHFLLEGGPVRVLGGTTLEGGPVCVLCERRWKDLVKNLPEFIGFPPHVARGGIEGEGSDRFGGRWYTGWSSEARSFLLEGRPVRVLGGTTLEGSGEDSSLFHRLPPRVARGGIEGEGSDRFWGR